MPNPKEPVFGFKPDVKMDSVDPDQIFLLGVYGGLQQIKGYLEILALLEKAEVPKTEAPDAENTAKYKGVPGRVLKNVAATWARVEEMVGKLNGHYDQLDTALNHPDLQALIQRTRIAD